MTAQCLISFGSNLGDPFALVAEAARMINAFDNVIGLRTSRLFETPPIGGPLGQEPFLNAVASFETASSARDILGLLQQTEHHLGRQRRQRWDARSIDLDVVLHGELVGGGTGLIVPHPRYTARQFVLRPACDVAPHYRDPRFGWTLERLARHLGEGVPSLALVGGDEAIRTDLCRQLTADYGIETFADRPREEPMAVVGHAPVLRELKSEMPSRDHSEAAIPQGIDHPWVSAFLPKLPSLESHETSLGCVPRLVARMQSTTPQTRWPAPHQMWPGGWRWPEYRLEIDDLTWAAREIASALDSMRCPAEAVTSDGDWW